MESKKLLYKVILVIFLIGAAVAAFWVTLNEQGRRILIEQKDLGKFWKYVMKTYNFPNYAPKARRLADYVFNN